VPELWFADDALLLSDSVAGLQLAFDCCAVVAKICGLQIRIKGKSKTAFMATYWEGDKEKDVEMGDGFGIYLPDGEQVPQIYAGEGAGKQAGYTVETKRKEREAAEKRKEHGEKEPAKDVEVRGYRYLGTEITPRWQNGQEEMREEARRTSIQVLQLIGRIPGLSNAQMSNVMSMAVGSMIGYWGRSTSLRWKDCEAIERARTAAMTRRGFSAGRPKLQMYADAEEGGLQHAHVYRVAAAALVDQIDRALCGYDGEPHREAVA
jgi:hypothetical protein